MASPLLGFQNFVENFSFLSYFLTVLFFILSSHPLSYIHFTPCLYILRCFVPVGLLFLFSVLLHVVLKHGELHQRLEGHAPPAGKTVKNVNIQTWQ